MIVGSQKYIFLKTNVSVISTIVYYSVVITNNLSMMINHFEQIVIFIFSLFFMACIFNVKVVCVVVLTVTALLPSVR